MKVGIHYMKKNWRKYIKPVWMNCISWEQGDPKIYKWLIFVISINSFKKGE